MFYIKICVKSINFAWILLPRAFYCTKMCEKSKSATFSYYKICVKAFNFAWIWATNFDWQVQILFNPFVSDLKIMFALRIILIFFALLFSCFMFHSFSFHLKFLWLFVVVMLKVVKIVSYPYFSIDHVHGKIKKSTKLPQDRRRFTNKQLFAIFDVQQISGSALYSVKEDWHFEVNYKSQYFCFGIRWCCVSKSARWKYIKTNVILYFR